MSDDNSTSPGISGSQVDSRQAFAEPSSSAAVDLLSLSFDKLKMKRKIFKNGENVVSFEYLIVKIIQCIIVNDKNYFNFEI